MHCSKSYIAIVEDDKIQREIIKKTLKKEHFHCKFKEYETPRKALGDIKAAPDEYCLILVDYHLPQMNGISFTKEIRKNKISVPVVFLTAEGDEHIAVKALKAGAYDYITKSDYAKHPDILLHTIQKTLKDYHESNSKSFFEDAFKESEKRYQRLVSLSPFGIIIHDTKRILFANQAASFILQAETAIDLINKKIMPSLSLLSKDLIHKYISGLSENRKEHPKKELRIKTFKNKTIDIEAGASIVEYEGSAAIQTVFHDITERKKYERDLRKAKQEAEAASLLKSRFIANLSHEIRTPLNAILGLSQLLGNMIQGQEEKEYIGTINVSGKILLKMLNDILDISKMESKKIRMTYSPVNIRKLISEIKALFEHSVKVKNLKFEIIISKTLPEICISDELRLKQVLINLVGNAIKFTEEGYVKISVKEQNSKADKDRKNLVFSVEDSGIGIPKSQHEKIFHEFTQQDMQCESFSGTGLGLSITKRLVKLLNGSISLKSEAKKGSLFTVILNDIKCFNKSLFKTRNDEIESREIQVSDFQKATILITDDVETNRILLRKYLEYPSIQILEAVNGLEAVNIAKEKKPDLILMDIRMPVMSGDKAIQLIKKDKRINSIPIIVVTASALDEEEKAIKKMSDGYLRKPVSKEQLIGEVLKYIKSSSPQKARKTVNLTH
ncbi:MAG: response regulator [Spirochaetia bacterium]|nr:response regulator [Spirochaetia bacterium]